ncbi:hypothetical protein ACQY0O_002097 [Thecaphora frezii]
MSFAKAPLRYLFNKSIEAAFNTSASSPASSTAAPTLVDADSQSDDAAFYPPRRPPPLAQCFKPQYAAPLRPPRDDAEAQKLYNHVRTVAWYLDALPLLGSQLPFNVGIDSLLGFIPGLGDYLGLLLGIYQIYLCSLFGLPTQLLVWMAINVALDCLIGLIPLVGDLLDVAFKANLRNLRRFEDHLRDTRGKCGAGQFYLEFPSNQRFLPVPPRAQRRGWFDDFFGRASEGPVAAGPPSPQSTMLGARSTPTTAGYPGATATPPPSSGWYDGTTSGEDPLHRDGDAAALLALPLPLATQVDDAIAQAHAHPGSGIEGEHLGDGPAASAASAAIPAEPARSRVVEVEGYVIPQTPERLDGPSQSGASRRSELQAGNSRGRASFEPLEIEQLEGHWRSRSPGSPAILTPSPGLLPPAATIDAEWILGSSPEHRRYRRRDAYESASDAAANGEEDPLIATSPESVAAHRRGDDPFIDLGVGSARSSMTPASRTASKSGSFRAPPRTPCSSSSRADSSPKHLHSSMLDSSEDFFRTDGGDSTLRQGRKRNVSWHESLSRPRNRGPLLPDTDDDDNHDGDHEIEGDGGDDSEALTARSSGVFGRRDRRDRRAETRAQWRRRRTMYFVVYSAIFCVAYMTSLDANTGYLYLNFACSEYGALASFSTVAIVQQMIFAVAKPPIAKLSDVFGRAEAYVLSLLLYVSGYAVVASTASLRSLIGGICLQSAGNTGVQVLQSIIIADTTTAKWRGLVIGIVNLPYLINFAVAGPLVDVVMRHGSWRLGYAIWTVMVPLAATPLLITLAVGQRRARRAGLATRNPLMGKGWADAMRELARELDAIGLLLFTGGWLLILLPLTLAGHGERSEGIPPLLLFFVGALLLVAFAWWETKAVAPILPYQFLANRAVISVCVVGILDFASFYISWTFLSAFIQILKGWDQTKTGYFATTQNVTSTVTGIVVGSLMAMTRRYKTLLVAGLVIRLVGVSMMIRYRNADDSTWMLVLCQLLQGIGGGSIAITMQVAVQVTVRHSDVAIVTALELLTTEIGAAIGSATAGWMFKSYLPGALRQHLPGMDEQELHLVYGSLQAALKYPLGSEERTGIILAWVQVMRYLCIAATLALVPALFFGMAIPDTHLPDVHGSAISHHHHHQHHSATHKGERRRSATASGSTQSVSPSTHLSHSLSHSNGTGGGDGGGGSGKKRTRDGRKRSRSRSRSCSRYGGKAKDGLPLWSVEHGGGSGESTRQMLNRLERLQASHEGDDGPASKV